MYLNIIALGIMLGSFVVMTYTLVWSALNGYVILVNVNSYGEAIFEVVGVLLVTPFVLWQLYVIVNKEITRRVT